MDPWTGYEWGLPRNEKPQFMGEIRDLPTDERD